MRTFIPPPTPVLKAIPLPPPRFNGIKLNPRLTYVTGPHIVYDVRHHPESESTPNTSLGWLHEPATNPRTNEMIIVCILLPRPFAVRPSSAEYDFVTIRDILVATYDEFRKADAAGDDWAPRFPSGLIGRYKWAGLSEKCEAGTWVLHIE